MRNTFVKLLALILCLFFAPNLYAESFDGLSITINEKKVSRKTLKPDLPLEVIFAHSNESVDRVVVSLQGDDKKPKRFRIGKQGRLKAVQDRLESGLKATIHVVATDKAGKEYSKVTLNLLPKKGYLVGGKNKKKKKSKRRKKQENANPTPESPRRF